MNSDVVKAQSNATARVNDLFRIKGETESIVDGLLNDLHTIKVGIDNEREDKLTLEGYTIDEWKDIADQRYADCKIYKDQYNELLKRLDDVAEAAAEVTVACNQARGY